MEILQLKYFCEAALSENFSQTAKKFGVPPSDVSQSIKRLEGEIGAPLFTRYPNRLRLNERGEAFYKKAWDALALLAEAVEEATERYEQRMLRLCVNCHRRTVMEVIEAFRARHPEVRVEMDTFSDPNLGDYDVIVASGGRAYERYRRRLLMTERILLAVPASHPLAERESVSARELAVESFIAMSEYSSLTEPAETIYRAGGFAPRIALKTDDPFYFRRGIEMGLGIAFVPELSWRGQFSNGIRLIPCGDFSREVYLYTDKAGYRGGVVSEFVGLLEERMRSLESECAE